MVLQFSGRLTAVTDGEKTLAEYVYSASGNPVVKKIGGNITSTYAYDELLNIKALKTETEKQTLADNHYFYDGNGNQIRREGLEGTTGYAYDGRNRLTEISYPSALGGYTEKLGYDAAGNRIRRETEQEITTYRYDNCNRLQELRREYKNTETSTAQPQIIRYTYDRQGSVLADWMSEEQNCINPVLRQEETLTYQMNKGNIEMLEIKNQEIIENPNPENNVYTDYIYSKGFGRVVTNLFWWLIEFFLFVYGGYRLLYPLVRQRELNITVFVIFIIYIGAQIIWLSIGSMDYRRKREKNIIKTRGARYPGVVVENKLLDQSGFHGTTIKVYVLTIRYADSSFQMEGVSWNPALVLENPYCDVYKYKKSVVATNFKVVEKYITEDGITFDYFKAVNDTKAMRK